MANSTTITPADAQTGSESMTFSLDTTGSSSSIYIRPGQVVTVMLGGTCAGDVSVDLSTDGSTYYKMSLDSAGDVELSVTNPSIAYQFTAPPAAGCKARVTFTRTSGTLTGKIF